MNITATKTAALLERGQTLLTYKTRLNSFWQVIANNFYPQRAYFTYNYQAQNQIFDGFPFDDQFANNLTTSYPILVARDLKKQTRKNLDLILSTYTQSSA